MLYIAWSLVRRRVTRRFTGSELCATFLNIAKYCKTVRCGCGAVAFILSIYLKPGLYWSSIIAAVSTLLYGTPNILPSIYCSFTLLGIHERSQLWYTAITQIVVLTINYFNVPCNDGKQRLTFSPPYLYIYLYIYLSIHPSIYLPCSQNPSGDLYLTRVNWQEC